MIDAGSIRHIGLKGLVTKGRSKAVPQNLVKRIKNRLAVLEAMIEISDLPQSYGAHELSGKRKGTWSIWVSGPWRITFKFKREAVIDLDLEQYH